MLGEIGLSVVRTIPMGMLPGIVSGAYSLHGGVVRDGAGQIVAHLISSSVSSASSLANLVPGVSMLSSAISNGQLYMLAKDVQALQSTVSSALNVASAGAALSGMGLVVSIAGFAYLNRRIEQVEKLILEIKDLIEIRYLADLKSAMSYLKSAEESSTSIENRRALLLEAQKNFSTLSHLYGDLLPKTAEPKQMRAIEGFYSLAFTGASIANSELGMGDVAVRQFREHQNHWTSTVRQYINHKLIDDHPESLQAVSSDILTTAEMTSILDFASNTNRGYEWLDDFRKPNQKGLIEKTKDLSLGLQSQLTRSFSKNSGEMIDLAKTWTHKSQVLESHSAHLAFLAQKKLSVGKFSQMLKSELDESGADALCVLHPA